MNFFYLIAAEEPNGVHLAGDRNEIYWGSVAFFIVLGLIIWKALPLMRQSLNDRTTRIQGELDAARADRQAAEQALNASAVDTPDLGKEEEKIRTEAKATAEKLKVDLVAKAEADADALRERGRADVATMKRQARADLSAEVSRMTRDSAEAVVLEGLDSKSHNDLIDSYINQVSQMS